jgi:PhnB protein
MAVKLNPYLNFKDNAREAMEFYKSVFGGELTLSTFKEGGVPDSNPDVDNLIMHAQLITTDGLTLMGADTPPSMEFHQPAGFGVSLSGDDEAKLRGYYDKLAEGGTVTMPMDKAPWGDIFGMCTDQYGTPWLINIAAVA